MGPARERGASITPAFEGWYQNEDGSYSLLIGYFNRNSKEALDIPIGPNNRIEPGEPDQGQPTHFEIGRQWGVFVAEGAEGLRQDRNSPGPSSRTVKSSPFPSP